MLVDFAAPPLVNDVLVARKDRLYSEHHGTVADQGSLFQQRPGKPLACGQCMVVGNQYQVSRLHRFLHICRGQNGFVRAIGCTEVFQILAAADVVVGADLAFHCLERMSLRRRAPRPQV